ncbi:branched-chain amino acid ABC transporter permease [uncultured Thermosynechococcus sp.]|uniref:branched-chain amino acid ABC transporter permease n=1 Tax=uncultured Thermosynechococcus sp. TaxID=436945 RepID=UPI002637F01F|nr:branched-chain amino acid ABC transporter permease [uncultured Thermosynechococcus sp.]
MGGWLGTYDFLLVSMTLGAMLALSLYLPLMSGQLSLASPAFYAIGGYVAALVSTRVFAGLNPYPVPLVLGEIVLAAMVCGLVGWGLGVPVLRLRGVYFAIATIAFSEVLRVLTLNLEITGGAIGIFGIPQPFSTPLGYLWLTVPLLIGVAIAIGRLEQTPAGKAMQAIRADELVAQTLGIDATRYKVLGFVLGAILAGVTGVLAAHLLNTWNPRQGTFDTGVLALTAVLVGGNRTFVGAIAGGMLFTALPELLRGLADQPYLPRAVAAFFRDGRLMLYGLLIILGTQFFPKGLCQPPNWRSLWGTISRSRKQVKT